MAEYPQYRPQKRSDFYYAQLFVFLFVVLSDVKVRCMKTRWTILDVLQRIADFSHQRLQDGGWVVKSHI